MAFDLLLLLVLLGTLLCCAITDRAYGKIPNKVLFSSSLVALLLQSQTYQHNALLKGTILLAVIGIILYALHIFSAGDSKLLIFIGLSFPYHFLLKTPFLSLLLIPCFSFIIGVVHILCINLFLIVRNPHSVSWHLLSIQFQKATLNYLKTLVFIFLLNNIILTHLMGFFGANKEPWFSLITYGCMFAVLGIKQNSKIFSDKHITILIFLIDAAFVLYLRKNPFSLLFLRQILVLGSYYFLVLLLTQFGYEAIPISRLEQGMILSQVSAIQLIVQSPVELHSFNENLSSRLTGKEVAAIQSWANKTNRTQQSVTIVKMVHFATFILAGTIIYLMMIKQGIFDVY